jgi:hypothetical protein
MATEADYTRKIVKALKQRLPNAVTFKHADMFTMGVPDYSVTRGGVTTWFEAKHLDEAKNWDFSTPDYQRGGLLNPRPDIIRLRPTLDVPAAQWETLRRLLRGYLVLYTPHGHAITRVTGFRDSVGHMRLQMITIEELVRRIIEVSEMKEDNW